MRKVYSLVGLVGLSLGLKHVLSTQGRWIALRRNPNGNFVHQWRTGIIVLPHKSIDAIDFCEDNRGLFTHVYTPKRGDCVLDFGAGVGSEVTFFLDLIGPEGLLVCIEPDPSCFSLLEQTIEATGARNVIAMNVAVSDQSGRAPMHLSGGFGTTNSLFGASQQVIDVPTVTLETVIDLCHGREIDFVKMNIEGAEGLVFRSTSEKAKRVRNWCVSCHDFMSKDTATKETVSQGLKALGWGVTSPPVDQSRPWVGDYVFSIPRD